MSWTTKVLEGALTEQIGDGGRVTHAVFTTHDLDPAFFEDQILPALVPDGVSRHRLRRTLQMFNYLREDGLRVDVFYEPRALVADGPAAGQLPWNRFPIHPTTGVFHPKVVLALVENENEKHLVVLTGSANLRPSSWRTNIEVGHATVIRAGARDGQVSGLRRFVRRLRSRGEGGGEATRAILRFLDDEVVEYSNRRVNGQLVPAFYSGDGDLAEFLSSHLGDDVWNLKLEVVSPFFDHYGIDTLTELMAMCGVVEARVVLPRVAGKITVTPAIYDAINGHASITWASLAPGITRAGQGVDAGDRRLHAKAYRFFRGGQWPVEFIFAGSPNLTRQGHSGVNNWEAGVLEQSAKPNARWSLDPVGTGVDEVFVAIEPEDSEARGVPLDLRFDWATLTAETRWWGKREESLDLTSSGIAIGTIAVARSTAWQPIAPHVCAAMSARLPFTSVVFAASSDRLGPVLVSELNVDQKPLLLDGVELTAAQILEMWALDERGIQRMLGSLKVRVETDPDTAEFAGTLPAPTDSIFERFAGVFHGFASLRRRVTLAVSVGEKKRAASLVYGRSFESLSRLLRALDMDADPVLAYVVLASAHDFVTWARAKYPWMEKGREHAAAELNELLASAQTLRQQLIEDDPSLADFLPWFDEQFPATAVGRR